MRPLTSRLNKLKPCTASLLFTRHNGNIASLLARDTEAECVTIHGWVRSLRKQKKVAFAAITDGSTLDAVQAVLKVDDASRLSTGVAVRLSGPWKASAGKQQSRELQAEEVKILGANDSEQNPIQPKYHSPDYLRTIPHLRPRIPAQALLLRLRSHVIASATSFFHGQGFIQVHTPIITSSDCEGAGEAFTVAVPDDTECFFKAPKYLTVSSQLHLEALSQAVDRVWTLSPTFRAEKSDTHRHLSEFYMLEAEVCFTQELEPVMALVECFLRTIAADVQNSTVGKELLRSQRGSEGEAAQKILSRRWEGVSAANWPRITYAEAINLLQKAATDGKTTFVVSPSYDGGLQAEHERYITATVGEDSRPVFVTDYPAEQKPFYMLPSGPGTVACFDLLVPDVLELAGGSLREHQLEELQRAMQTKGMAGHGLKWYKDLRRFGSVAHGGFGLGFDRLLCYLSGISNVRDVVAFPRWHGRCEC
ncbi:asparaginyl-tRNA synthetase [Piedraia hortae CBS 480.64]|uniref:asparagine--tRNA ligase n=1 Tax=Piedraia hortae CBS 480.64 TaxID=1314780 RepID=A0A6A7BWM0_9PEZI|nr:asparaginyl-tRNA synthetase [Piedraia hortae CBS 480.64]